MTRRLDTHMIALCTSLVALLVVNIVLTPNFLAVQTLAVNVSQVSTIAIVALGMTLVIAAGGVDLSVGAVMAVAGALAPLIFLSAWGNAHPQLSLLLSFVVPLLVAMLCGAFNGALVGMLGVQPIIATLIFFIAGRGLAQVLTNGNLQTFSNPSFVWLGTGRFLGFPVQGWIALLLTAGLYCVVRYSLYGRYLLATGGNPKAAEMSGIPVVKVKITTYAIASFLAGLSGLVVVAVNSAADAAQIGQLMELDAIAASVVGGAALSGGRAPIVGTLLGAIFIQLLRYTLVANGVPDELTLIVTALIIVGAVWIQYMRKVK
ncbi:TPA: ABC transporter permease [Klebsiella pneumoniae]